jgi:hypothetical protein
MDQGQVGIVSYDFRMGQKIAGKGAGQKKIAVSELTGAQFIYPGIR